MPNWCYNDVQFFRKTQQVIALFEKMAKLEGETNHGQRPSFIKTDPGYLFDIYVEEGSVSYSTKWAPNTSALLEIAKRFHVGFVHEYHEPNMGIFGKATFEYGIFTDTSLDFEDLEQIDYDEERGYLFEGETYESDIEIMEIILDRKIGGEDISRDYGR